MNSLIVKTLIRKQEKTSLNCPEKGEQREYE